MTPKQEPEGTESRGWFKRRLWNSRTITTWSAQASAIAKFGVPLPFILVFLPTADVAVWLLLMTWAQIVFMLDFGFAVTTSRFTAYAMGGATNISDLSPSQPRDPPGEPNWPLVVRIAGVTTYIYLLLALIGIVAIGLVGSTLMARPISATLDPQSAWLAWGVILLGSCFKLGGGQYAAYLQGVDAIPSLRRWETMTNSLSALTLVAVVALGGGLLALAAALQVWNVVTVIGNAYMAQRHRSAQPAAASDTGFDWDLMETMWSKAWRSGLGIMLNSGAVRATGPLMAQVAAPTTVAAYLLIYSILDRLRQMSRAPFDSRIPMMARLFGSGKLPALLQVGRRRMLAALVLFLVGSTAAGFGLQWYLEFSGSETPFLGLGYWGAMALPLLIHMAGAMYLQMYTLTNHVVWHVVDGISGALYFGSAAIAYPFVGIWAVPIGLMVGYGAFYTGKSLKLFSAAFGPVQKTHMRAKSGGGT